MAGFNLNDVLGAVLGNQDNAATRRNSRSGTPTRRRATGSDAALGRAITELTRAAVDAIGKMGQGGPAPQQPMPERVPAPPRGRPGKGMPEPGPWWTGPAQGQAPHDQGTPQGQGIPGKPSAQASWGDQPHPGKPGAQAPYPQKPGWPAKPGAEPYPPKPGWPPQDAPNPQKPGWPAPPPAPARQGSVPATGPAPASSKPGAAAGGWGVPPPAAPAPGPWSAPAAPPPTPAMAEHAEALLLIRTMIAAAKADGTIDAEERGGIARQLDTAGLSPAERDFVLADFDRPLAPAALAAEAHDPMQAAQLYAAAFAATHATSPGERAWLDAFARALRLDRAAVDAIERQLGGHQA